VAKGEFGKRQEGKQLLPKNTKPTFMNKENHRTLWIKMGCICGLLGGCLYFAAAFISMPDLLVYIAAFVFGPLPAIGCTGLYYFLSANDESPVCKLPLSAPLPEASHYY
jgi:hypothetical protein